MRWPTWSVPISAGFAASGRASPLPLPSERLTAGNRGRTLEPPRTFPYDQASCDMSRNTGVGDRSSAREAEMNLAVQQLVDRLATRLGRPAVLEDRFFRLVAYSAHDGPVDAVREASILRRHASAEVSRWLGDVGVREARGPVRIPGNAELDMLPRVCFPIRHRGVLFGYLWFIDAEQSLSPSDVDWCASGAT